MNCKICKLTLKDSNLSLSIHLKQHDITFIDYKIKYDNFIVPKCKICRNDAKYKEGVRFRVTCGSNECIKKHQKARKHTDKTKEKIRIKRFEILSLKSGKTAWERRSNGEMSYLEQLFYDDVIIKFNLLDMYDISYDLPCYPYFIDFAFINIKLAVELDGACHFKYNERIEHDIKRDKYLNEKGWKTFRIAYNENFEEKVNELFDYLKGKEFIYDEKELEKRLYKGKVKDVEKKHSNREEYLKKMRLENYEKEKSNIEKVLNSDIDFSKIGWVEKVSLLIDKKPQKINGWMKKYLYDFWKDNCFKRKGTKI